MMNFLDPSDETMLQRLLLNQQEATADPDHHKVTDPNFKSVAPKPGFCVKTKDAKGEKVFINVCIGENLPKPRDITDEEVLRLIESEDASSFRVPMSLGEPHAELDKSGKGCSVYDVVINPDFYKRVQESETMMGFFLTVVMQGIGQKYQLELEADWRILKNRRFIGSLPEQNVRTQTKPWIQEMDGGLSGPGRGPLISEISSNQEPPKPKAAKPAFTIIQEPPDSHPEFLVAEIHLPNIKSAASMTVDVGEDRILLETRSNIYRLDIYLPYDVIQAECASQFNRNTKILTITMPVVPVS